MGDAVGPQRRHERSGDVVLPDDLLESVGTVAAVQSGGHGPSLIGRADPVRGAGRVGCHLARWESRRIVSWRNGGTMSVTGALIARNAAYSAEVLSRGGLAEVDGAEA